MVFKVFKYSSIQIGQEGFFHRQAQGPPIRLLRHKLRDRGILKKIQTAWWFGSFYVPLPSKSIIILKPLKTMKQRRLLLTVLTMLTLSAFGGEQEDIVGRIKALYDAIA